MGRLGAIRRLASRASDAAGAGDEETIEAAEAQMRSMTGNAGQDAILDEAMPNFKDWAQQALEAPAAADDFPDVLDLREDKYDGTDEIWDAGYSMIADQSKYHDRADEGGEGAGQVFDAQTFAN